MTFEGRNPNRIPPELRRPEAQPRKTRGRWLPALGLVCSSVTGLPAAEEVATEVCVYGGTSGGVIAAVSWSTNSSCAIPSRITLNSGLTGATVSARDTVPANAGSKKFLRPRITRQ